MKICALIMAGGIGTRFWPQSTSTKPKQFLNLIGDKTMLQMTYDRINKLIPKEDIFIVTNREYHSLVKEQLSGISDVNIIGEPCGKNTAPCILLSSIYLKNLYGEVNVVCVASDSYIEKEKVFLDKIKTANDFITKDKEAIVTLGITPTRPETGYGYIKYVNDDQKVKKVLEFKEKPDFETAKKYLVSGEYLWNAGMFIFNNLKMLEELNKNLHKEYELLINLPKWNDQSYEEYLEKQYEKCDKISIDYAVMEKSPNVYTIPSDIGWDDVGTWAALSRYIKEDAKQNITKGNVTLINSYNNIVYANGKQIILKDIEDIYCIDSDDVIIIGRKDSINEAYKLKEDIGNK